MIALRPLDFLTLSLEDYRAFTLDHHFGCLIEKAPCYYLQVVSRIIGDLHWVACYYCLFEVKFIVIFSWKRQCPQVLNHFYSETLLIQ